MSDIPFQTYAPELIESVVEVAGDFIGKSLMDSLRKSFSSSNQEQGGDYFMDQSRVLLQNHLQMIQLQQQIIIHRKYQKLRKVKQRLDSHDGSRFQKLLKARKYRRVSRETYKIIKNASDRARDDHLMSQISEATRQPGSGSGSGPETGTVGSNPFSDSHAISTVSEVSVNDLSRVEMSTYQEEATGEAAVVLDLVAEDESVQHIVATFSTEAFSEDSTDSSAPAALSLHREDGSTPSFIATSLPDVSDQRADDQGEVDQGEDDDDQETRTSDSE